MQKKGLLSDIVAIRLFLILQLVVYHAFIIYMGGWKEPSGYFGIAVYEQIASWSYSFFLEAFVAISGYLYFYQIYDKGRTSNLKSLILGKLNRLIVPSIIFSVAYYTLLMDHRNLGEAIYTIINGAGHMWFLPMLFWCYVGGWILTRVHIGDSAKIVFLLLLAMLSFVPIPFRISNAMYYSLFFYIGMLVRKHSNELSNLKLSHIIIIWGAYAAVFITSEHLLNIFRSFDSSIIEKLIRFEVYINTKILYAGLAVIALFATANKIMQKCEMPQSLIKISSYCFGVYLFQQFILQILYYKTSFPTIVGFYVLPWVSTIITLILSLLLTHYVLKNKYGAKLIG